MNNFLKACSQFCNLEETTFQHPEIKYSLASEYATYLDSEAQSDDIIG